VYLKIENELSRPLTFVIIIVSRCCYTAWADTGPLHGQSLPTQTQTPNISKKSHTMLRGTHTEKKRLRGMEIK
jgi:hypothetical protein